VNVAGLSPGHFFGRAQLAVKPLFGESMPLATALTSVPREPTMTAAIRPRINAYSAAEAPDSSWANRRAFATHGLKARGREAFA
jgi:hypothetical protein